MCGESIFITTGRPISSASTIASEGERATTVWAIGMRKAASSAFDSISLSTLRPSPSAVSITSRADSRRGAIWWEIEAGACISSCWLR